MKFHLQTAAGWKEYEKASLAPYAAKSDSPMAVRQRPESEHTYRTAFQRDRDRIIHSHAFRRLKHKRQVFLITYGDHFRTRLTHTLEVSQLARTMARALRVNEDLVEAIALGHDLGHTPFGHLGEMVLDDILQGRDTLDGLLPASNHGGFKHNYQSLRIVDCLEHKYEFAGLNLAAAVREGILKHTHLKSRDYRYPDIDFGQLHFASDFATSIEGQLVAIADEVAQRTHDLEDGLRAALVGIEEVRELEIVKLVERRLALARFLPAQKELYGLRLINGLIEFLVTDIIEESMRRVDGAVRHQQQLDFFETEVVAFSAGPDALQKELNRFIYARIICAPSTRGSDGTVRELLRGLFGAYLSDPAHQPPECGAHGGRAAAGDPRPLADFIAGMTDNYALAEASRLRQQGILPKSLDLRLLLPSWIVRVE